MRAWLRSATGPTEHPRRNNSPPAPSTSARKQRLLLRTRWTAGSRQGDQKAIWRSERGYFPAAGLSRARVDVAATMSEYRLSGQRSMSPGQATVWLSGSMKTF
jgi:hypothetical protein